MKQRREPGGRSRLDEYDRAVDCCEQADTYHHRALTRPAPPLSAQQFTAEWQLHRDADRRHLVE